jgi:hypothetical protein
LRLFRRRIICFPHRHSLLIAGLDPAI